MNLNAQQLEAVTTTAFKNLIIAGAGSGKTKTLIARIVHLIGLGIKPSNIVVITFTNAAANEVKERLNQTGTKPRFVGTLHAYMVQMMRESGRAPLTVLDEEQAEDLLQKIIEECRYKKPRKLLDSYLAIGPRCLVGRLNEPQIVAKTYWDKLEQNSMMDFDYILHRGLALIPKIHAIPDASALFVDEYQDSGNLDAEIYQALPFTYKMFVGDSDQSIYGFRGGNVEHINRMAFQGDYQVARLETNYRCGSVICDAAQKLIENNFGRIPKTMVSGRVSPGAVEIKSYPNAFMEFQQIGQELLSLQIKDAAVLLRTNYLAREALKVFEGMGLMVTKKEVEEMPADWKFARLIVSAASNPFNDVLATLVLEKWLGKDKAKAEVNRAIMAKKSLNQSVLNLPTDGRISQDFINCLTRLGVSTGAVDKVKTFAAKTESGKLSDLSLALASAFYHRDEVGEGIVVTTIHGAKGREFDTVYLPAFEETIVPMGNADDLQEERRLAYVAMTRAKNRLVISYCAERKTEFKFKPEPALPSRFIKEAGL